MTLQAILLFAMIALIILIIVAGYVKAPPDRAYIISGMRRNPRILIGRAGVKIPFFERVDKLYLGQMTVDIKTEQSVPTNDFINVNVDAVAKVRIGTDTESIQLAAKNFLNKDPEQITMDLQDSLQGNMREIIGTLALKTINTDRDSFSDQVMEKASRDMSKLGIEILSCNIQNVTDENGLISDLGMDNTAKIKKDAAIAKAQADRDVAIAQAEADKAANDARVLAQTEIAKPLSQIDKINIYGTGDGSNGASQISGNMPIVMKQVFDTMSEATGVDFTEIMRAGTYDAKVNKNINITGADVSVETK
ncbi:flotillin family protein [Butyrivibrio sp. VCB2001]|uniref:flotillin family protein n=1 Tax=Butyrivibrio sp. VCB2001 TaxID=1280667 RepID=UPI00041AD460|nr:flotillin family protein [Butyrivibrio sp. VCB2001]